MSNYPRHLAMIAPTSSLECDSRIIHMINSFCDAGTKVSVVCPPQHSDNTQDLAQLLHNSATVFVVPEYFSAAECYDLAPYLGHSLSSFSQRLYSWYMSTGTSRQLGWPIKKLPFGLRQIAHRIINAWFKQVERIREEAAAEHRYWLHYFAQQLPPPMYKKYREVIALEYYHYFFFIQTLIINRSVEPIDAIFCNDLWSLPVGCLVKELLGITLLYDSHEIGTYIIEDPIKKAIVLKNEEWMYKLCDRFITVNDSCAEYYTKLCPFLKPLVITNAHRLPTEIPSGTATLKQRLSLSVNVPLAVYVGSLHPLYHMDRFIQAIAQCQSNLHLAIVGAGGDIERLQTIASELNLNKRVFFLGRVNYKEVHPTIYGADLGIC